MKERSALRTAGIVLLGLLLLPLAVTGALRLLIAVGDNPHDWLREEAYRAAVDAALRDYDEEAGDPALPARDFTAVRMTRVPTYSPCPLSAGELRISPQRCSAEPGPKPKPDPRLCKGGACVVLGVTPDTWADVRARAALLATVRDRDAICRDADLFAPNHKASARAAGCGGRTFERVHLVFALVPRRPNPCRVRRLPTPVGAYTVACEHAAAAQVAVS